jgi:hypothetical protein
VLAGAPSAKPGRRAPPTTAHRPPCQETNPPAARIGALSIVGEGLLQLTTIATD